MATNKQPIVAKIDPSFREWLQDRQKNIQSMIGLPIKVTMMDTQRLIAKTDGVKVTSDMIKRMRKEQ